MNPRAIDLYQVDAFASQVFAGNPAAVCPLERWLDDDVMQAVAAENNLAETAFIVANPSDAQRFSIRWFTPEVEIDLCGHATLAAAHVLVTELGYNDEHVTFDSQKKGPLSVTQTANGYALDMPSFPPNPSIASVQINQALGVRPIQNLSGNYHLAVLAKESDVRDLCPDMSAIKNTIPGGMVVVTAPGDTVDFVSRFFAPAVGIDEDPVTGSAHCILTPYWAERLGKDQLTAKQLSKRGGKLGCQLKGNRVLLTGQCATYLAGKIYLPAAQTT